METIQVSHFACEAESGPQRRPTPHVRRESGWDEEASGSSD